MAVFSEVESDMVVVTVAAGRELAVPAADMWASQALAACGWAAAAQAFDPGEMIHPAGEYSGYTYITSPKIPMPFWP